MKKTDEWKDELYNDLSQSLKTEKALRAQTNSEIANLLKEHIWAELNVFSARSVLLEEVIRRLGNNKNLEEDGGL